MENGMKERSGEDIGNEDVCTGSDSQAVAGKTGAKPKTAAEKRAERLRAELRANLARRKIQARARREGKEDDRPGKLLSSADEDDGG